MDWKGSDLQEVSVVELSGIVHLPLPHHLECPHTQVVGHTSSTNLADGL